MVAVRSFSLLGLVLFGTLLAGPASAQSWSVLDLGFLDNADAYGYAATGLNNVGQVIGTYITGAGDTHGFITGPNGAAIQDLGTLGGFSDSYAMSINASGQVVGYASTPQSSLGAHAFVTGPNGVGMTDLGMVPGAVFSQAMGVNNAGQVVGASGDLDTSIVKAFVSDTPGAPLRELNVANGTATLSVATAINNAGQVVGSYGTSDFDTQHAFIGNANGTGLRALGALAGDDTSLARAINDAGVVVGWSTLATAGAAGHAFITGPNGVGLRDLGTLGGEGSFAEGLNKFGQVVGYAQLSDGTSHAFVTGPDGVGLLDVNTLATLVDGATFVDATGINDLGQLVVNSSDGHAYLLTPSIPEPGTWGLMLLGLGLTGVAVRRHRPLAA